MVLSDLIKQAKNKIQRNSNSVLIQTLWQINQLMRQAGPKPLNTQILDQLQTDFNCMFSADCVDAIQNLHLLGGYHPNLNWDQIKALLRIKNPWLRSRLLVATVQHSAPPDSVITKVIDPALGQHHQFSRLGSNIPIKTQGKRLVLPAVYYCVTHRFWLIVNDRKQQCFESDFESLKLKTRYLKRQCAPPYQQTVGLQVDLTRHPIQLKYVASGFTDTQWRQTLPDTETILRYAAGPAIA